ncbi:MAG: ABC transporter ATP-binding protein [Smithella sp.]
MTSIIETINLSRKFSSGSTEVLAVNNVSLRLDEGEFLLLMGPSGSGKTTLLALLGCILKPTSGRINIFGHDVSILHAKELARLRAYSIGFVFQGFNLMSALTAWENVALVGDFLNPRLHDIRSRSMELLKSIGLGHRLHHLPEDLSAGEKQRVAFARSLIGNPKIILADEPTANLDAENRNIVVGLLKQAARMNGASVIIATHDERIQGLADRIIRIEDGSVV